MNDLTKQNDETTVAAHHLKKKVPSWGFNWLSKVDAHFVFPFFYFTLLYFLTLVTNTHFTCRTTTSDQAGGPGLDGDGYGDSLYRLLFFVFFSHFESLYVPPTLILVLPPPSCVCGCGGLSSLLKRCSLPCSVQSQTGMCYTTYYSIILCSF